MTNKTLGRGLSAFLDLDGAQETINGGRAIINLPIDSIIANPYQPRQSFDDESLEYLSKSIKQNGVLQPILVKKISDNSYQLIAGERRLRATKIAGIEKIPAIVIEIDQKKQLEVAILENVQREDLNPIDEAEGYKRLIEEFHYTQEKISELLGKSRSHITNILRLLTLSNEVIALVRNGDITFGHARAIVGLENAPALAERIIRNSMNVRETEELVRRVKTKSKELHYQNEKKFTDPEILNVENQLSSLIGLRVNVKLKNNSGVVIIEFKNFEELDNLVGKLNTVH